MGLKEKTTMKALSIKQPWAWLIVHDYKHIENRTWIPNIDVPTTLAIHASKAFDRKGYYWVQADFPDIPLPAISGFERSGIVGVVEYHGFVSTVDRWYKNPWFFGPYGWIFRNARPIEFIPCKGQLGLFEIHDRRITYLRETP
jgi:hypothetical protein